MNFKAYPGKIIGILVFLFLFSSTLIYTDEVSDIINKLEKELYKVEKYRLNHPDNSLFDKFKKIKDFSDFLKEIKKEEQRLNLSVSGAYSEDTAGQQKLSRLEINTGINKGYFPRTFQFNMGTTIQFKNKGLLEDVTKLQLSYDHYFSRWLKVYGFAERFADTYLSIRHRYEVGAGIKIEAEPFGLTREANEKWKEYDNCRINEVNNFIGFLNHIAPPPPLAPLFNSCIVLSGASLDNGVILALLKELCNPSNGKKNKKIERIERAFKKRHKIMILGLAVTVLSELEQAEIETTLNERETGENNMNTDKVLEDSVKFPLEAEQGYRLVVRPSLVIRPVDSVEIEGVYYHKFPLSMPKNDFRSLLKVQAKYDMSSSVPWAKKISVILEYQREYDNMPPQIPGSKVDKFINDYRVANNLEELSLQLGKTIAEKAHDKFQWKLEVQF
jgi:hypothetical protein